MSRVLVLVCCVFAAASAAQDNVLRFLSNKEVVRMAQQKHSAGIEVSSSGYKGDLPMEKFRAQSTVCPDGVTQCPDTSTCCPLRNGQYGCCQGDNAVCCKDGVHCCPQGFKCDEQHGRCTSDTRGISFHWVDNKVLRAERIPHLGANKTCPDNKTRCQPNDTCCHARNNTFGCCPLSHAVCCSDGLHCCPTGTKCDVVHRHCYREEDRQLSGVKSRPENPDPNLEVSEAPSWEKISKKQAVTCNDGRMCPDGSTCCLLLNGSYGCCSFSDKEQTEKQLLQSVRSVVCPGGQFECPDNNTCCRLASGDWGCCPQPNAVCCSDGVHCCPNGYTCKAEGCSKSDGQDSLPWSVKAPAMPREKMMTVECPNGGSCSDGNTCCLLADGNYGCCPYPQAVCCSDKLHCCPHGFTCELALHSCKNSTSYIPWLEKKPAVFDSVQSVMCPDGKSYCPDGSTCCKTTNGSYGCCRYERAVCCSDGIHCCPHDTKCDLFHQTCNKSSNFIPWQEQMPALQRVQPVICPDGKSMCPTNNTCCKLSSGSFGCCPLPSAVCCSDNIHCCPQYTTCDPEAQTCNRGSHLIPWQEQMPALQRVQAVICPDGTSQCPEGNTCCKLSSGLYGCCPLPNAVCCIDHLHCCPNGFTCGISQGTCNRGSYSVPWQKKQPALHREQAVVCPDEKSQCPDGNTCCKQKSGDYGCCPMPDAVCCTDGEHCCPKSYTCDLPQKTCNKGSYSLPWQKKQPALRSLP